MINLKKNNLNSYFSEIVKKRGLDDIRVEELVLEMVPKGRGKLRLLFLIIKLQCYQTAMIRISNWTDRIDLFQLKSTQSKRVSFNITTKFN
jgi:hypothetical protein